MDNGYGQADRQQQQQAMPQQQTQLQQRQDTTESAALTQAMRHLQAGVGLQDLSPRELREVAAILGNQTMVAMLGGDGSVPLNPETRWSRDGESTPPETAVEIRWPALTEPPFLARSGTLPERVFPLDHWRTMGHTPERRVPDG